jgi:hypothetical protein
MSTPTSEFLNSLVHSTAPRRGGRPLSDLRLQHLAGATLMWELMSQGVMGYAGDADKPRPVRPRSLYDVKKWTADYFPNARYRDAFPEDTLYFAFCHDRMAMPLEEAIPVSRNDLWWLVAPGDMLLLSDRRTHHYIGVYHVDDDAGRIDLLDPWPDRVFLKKGLNATGVEAVVKPFGGEGSPIGNHKLVSITRAEFLRVAVGIITKDTPELIDHYLVHRPEQRERLEIQLAFGLALMDAEAYVLARFAVSHFRAAMRLANAAQDTDRVEYTAARQLVVLVAAIHHQRWSGDAQATKPFEDELRHLTALYSEDRLLAGARSAELCTLGNAAGASADYAAAMRFLDVAVARFQDDEEPRRLRAKVRLTRQDARGALDDVDQALVHNARRIRELEERHDAWHANDRSSRSDDEARIGGLKERRFDELDMRVTALIGLRQLPEAREAAEELVAHAPNRSAGYAKLAAAEQLLGNMAAATANLRQALERERDPRIRLQMEALLKVGEAKAPSDHAPMDNGKDAS